MPNSYLLAMSYYSMVHCKTRITLAVVDKQVIPERELRHPLAASGALLTG
jgi:phosphotransferase system IIB component